MPKITDMVAATSTTGLVLAGAQAGADRSVPASLFLPSAGGAMSGRVTFPPSALTDAATTTLNAALSNFFTWVIGGNRALALSNVVTGQSYTVQIKQDATGGRTVSWPAGFTWPGGTAGVLSTGPNAVDVLTFITFDGTTFRAVLSKAFA